MMKLFACFAFGAASLSYTLFACFPYNPDASGSSTESSKIGGGRSSIDRKRSRLSSESRTIASVTKTSGVKRRPGSGWRPSSAVRSLSITSLSPESNRKIVGLEQTDGLQSVQLLSWDNQNVALMTRFGKMLFVPWKRIKEVVPSPAIMKPASTQQFLVKLKKQFGSQFKIRRSKHFVVLSPKNHKDQWVDRMETFYRRLESYCSNRRIPLRDPRFPLVAIVFPSKKSFHRYARMTGDDIDSNYQAYYSNTTNRIALMDDPNTSRLDLETVYHETAHQIFFNRGIHYRSATPPRWFAEGLATAFESPGMYDHRRSSGRADRINRYQYRITQSLANKGSLYNDIYSIISSDELFEKDSQKAYALAWAISFLCTETKPHKFSQFLQTTNRRRAFSGVSPKQRRKIFEKSFGCSIRDFANSLTRFYRKPL